MAHPLPITAKVLTMRPLPPLGKTEHEKAKRDQARAEVLAKFLTTLTDDGVPPTYDALKRLAQDAIDELNDINGRWRDEVRWRL